MLRDFRQLEVPNIGVIEEVECLLWETDKRSVNVKRYDECIDLFMIYNGRWLGSENVESATLRAGHVAHRKVVTYLDRDETSRRHLYLNPSFPARVPPGPAISPSV